MNHLTLLFANYYFGLPLDTNFLNWLLQKICGIWSEKLWIITIVFHAFFQFLGRINLSKILCHFYLVMGIGRSSELHLTVVWKHTLTSTTVHTMPHHTHSPTYPHARTVSLSRANCLRELSQLNLSYSEC